MRCLVMPDVARVPNRAKRHMVRSLAAISLLTATVLVGFGFSEQPLTTRRLRPSPWLRPRAAVLRGPISGSRWREIA